MMLSDFLDLGISVVPCLYRTKIPHVAWRQYQNQLPTQAEISLWFRPGRPINVAVICGWQGLTVIDFDSQPQYASYLDWALATSGPAVEVALETYRVQTAKGVHLYIFADDKPRSGKFSGGDIKGDGGYVLIPPSVHPSGATYVSLNDGAPIVRVRKLAEVLPDPPRLVRTPLLVSSTVFDYSTLYPRTLVEQIKEQVRIESLVPDLQVRGSGRWAVGRCPLHDDQSPSFRVDLDKQLAYCWTCTPKALDVIALYAAIHKIDNKQAVREMLRILS
jgi:Bifunctional DNA primase/polymerase, N-terminal/CHC2 zinc finger